MKREILILNVICVALALAFVGFALYNALTADSFSSFLTIDNLFITAFCLMMALIFISIPASWMVTTGVVKIPFMSASSDTTSERASLPAGARTTKTAAIGPGKTAATNALPARREIQKDAKGRPIPADVQSMVAEMNKSDQKTS
ncbi:MAG TPA: hypothetical protein VGO91_09665 [Pyrinomonadaceae bacterium]|jgi:hypothetical protein|nr:hypothetical protein [Pyrinomonadaceae bacterium]